jgi:hypothetical protein
MKKDINKGISQLFADAQCCIDNASAHPEIQKKMNQHGFTPKRILEGSAILDTAKSLQFDKQQKYGEKDQVTSQVKTDMLQARQNMEDHVAIVKFAFRKDPSTLKLFNVPRISRKVEAWLLQASDFYRVAATHSNTLAPHGLGAEEISQSAAMVEALSNARNQRMMKKGDAEEATRQRDTSVKALKAWLRDFRAIAKVALRDSPQLMEALGMVVKAEKV